MLFSMSVGGLGCIKGEIKGEMSASGYAWVLGSADVCCLVNDTEAGNEFQLSYLATLMADAGRVTAKFFCKKN